MTQLTLVRKGRIAGARLYTGERLPRRHERGRHDIMSIPPQHPRSSSAAQRLAEARGCLNFLVRRASRSVARYYDGVLRPSGLRGTQFNVMAVLAQTGALSLSELAARLGMERSALARNLKPLERQGLACVSTGRDRRVRLAQVTVRGKEKLRRALPIWARAQARLAGQLGAAETAELVCLLERVSDRLDASR